jgi:hypothetical protein
MRMRPFRLFGLLASPISSYLFSKWTCLFIRVYLNDTRSWAHLHLPASCCVHTATTGRQRKEISLIFFSIIYEVGHHHVRCIYVFGTEALNKTSVTNVRNVFAEPSGKETHYQFVVNLIDYVDGMPVAGPATFSNKPTSHQLEKNFRFFQSGAHLHTRSKNSRSNIFNSFN